jgi:hypothetical protein
MPDTVVAVVRAHQRAPHGPRSIFRRGGVHNPGSETKTMFQKRKCASDHQTDDRHYTEPDTRVRRSVSLVPSNATLPPSRALAGRFGVWRVMIDLQFPVLLLQAGHSLLPSDDQTTIPALVAADAAAAAAVEEARANIDRMRRERTLRDIESWSKAHTPRRVSWSTHPVCHRCAL